MDTRLNYQFVEVTDSISGEVWAGYYDTARIETEQPCVIHDNLSTMDVEKYPALPEKGRVEEGMFYTYNNKVVYCRQPHERTIYAPEQTPALFSFWRDNVADLTWIEGEKVEVGWVRIYNNVKYEVIQPHTTQVDYTPTATLGVLWKEVPQQSDEYAVFIHPTGAHDVYMKGDIVWYPTLNSTLYRSKIDNNSWSPDEYANGWEIYIP